MTTSMLPDEILSIDSSESRFSGGTSRFNTIVKQLLCSHGAARCDLRGVVVSYLNFSPHSSLLMNELINTCIARRSPDRLDTAVDVLSQLGQRFLDYATNFLLRDIERWHHVYSTRAYEPNDDYWYILLRSVAQSEVDPSARLRFVRQCRGATSRGVIEGVVEALGDIESEGAKKMLATFCEHEDPFIASLAAEVLADQE